MQLPVSAEESTAHTSNNTSSSYGGNDVTVDGDVTGDINAMVVMSPSFDGGGSGDVTSAKQRLFASEVMTVVMNTQSIYGGGDAPIRCFAGVTSWYRTSSKEERSAVDAFFATYLPSFQLLRVNLTRTRTPTPHIHPTP